MSSSSPKVVFQEESWKTYYPEAKVLWAEHYEELCQDKGRMKMGPDVGWYEGLEKAGVLQLVTAREYRQGDGPGKLVGYQISVLRRHTHYPVLCAFEDSFWLHPSYRKGKGLGLKGHPGVMLITESLRLLRVRGVQRVFFMSIESHPTDLLFRYLGFAKTHVTYSKWLGD